jgi:serine/threonine protein kinase
MSPELWREARQIFEEAIDKEPGERDAFVRAACKGDEPLLAEVKALIASHEKADEIFLNPVIEGVSRTDRLEGRELGPYRILHRLGQGGMGAVYLAERSDDQFRRRVAVKLVRPGYDDGHLLRRFRNERQLLAVLDHPNIIKLLDAGVTPDGIPYFVMDFVEGQPIDKYCETRRLSVPERLALFREVCAAVHCAHRNLVVHRDLKPSNIIVTPEGAPKLLDFGIAKLLRPEYGAAAIGLTRTLQPMTPEFASPEQVTGQPITTSSDVYSLGVLLYRLVAGKHPYEMNSNSAAEVERAICETEPERPSAVATRTLKSANSEVKPQRLAAAGDLDNIVLMAMRKEPQRRYASAEHLSEDIRRYLANLPVTARKDTLTYRASKFLRRHPVSVTAATLGTVAVIALAAFAGRERGDAAASLSALRQSTAFMLDLDDKLVESLTVGRQALVSKAIAQVATIEHQAGADEALIREAALGYGRIGNTLGNPLRPNLGQYDQARENYQKMLQLAGSLKPGDRTNRTIAIAHTCLGRLDVFLGSPENAEAHFKTALQLYETAHYQRGVMTVWEQRGMVQQNRGNLRTAIESYSTSLRIANELDRAGHTPQTQSDIASESSLYGLALGRAGKTSEAIEALDRSMSIYQLLSPKDASKRREIAVAEGSIGFVLHRAQQDGESVDWYRRALELCRMAHQQDPNNQQARIDLGQMNGEIADVLWAIDQQDEARKVSRSAVDLLEPVVNQDSVIPYFLQQYAEFLLAPSNERQNPASALNYARRADDAENHSNPDTLATLSHAYLAMGDRDHSVETAQKALALIPEGGDPLLRRELQRRVAPPPAPPAEKPRERKRSRSRQQHS